MRTHDADEFEQEWAELLAFLWAWTPPPSGDVLNFGWGAGYNPDGGEVNLPRWYSWTTDDQRSTVRPWNCHRCRTELVRLEAVAPVVVTVDPGTDGQRHEWQVHPGGLAMIVAYSPVRDDVSAADVKAMRDSMGRGITKSAAGVKAWGWWCRDLQPAEVSSWCPRCRVYRRFPLN